MSGRGAGGASEKSGAPSPAWSSPPARAVARSREQRPGSDQRLRHSRGRRGLRILRGKPVGEASRQRHCVRDRAPEGWIVAAGSRPSAWRKPLKVADGGALANGWAAQEDVTPQATSNAPVASARWGWGPSPCPPVRSPYQASAQRQ